MIITIEDNIDDYIALNLVLNVVASGKISHDTKGNAYYCWCSIVECNGTKYKVWTRKNKNQPSFIVAKCKTPIENDKTIS